MKITVTFTNQELINAQAALLTMGRESMAIKPGFIVAQNRKIIDAIAADYWDFRKKLLTARAKLTERDEVSFDKETGKVEFKTPEDEVAAIAEIEELNEQEVSVEIRTIRIDAMGTLSMPADMWRHLTWMIEDEDEAKAD